MRECEQAWGGGGAEGKGEEGEADSWLSTELCPWLDPEIMDPEIMT